ncbi:MAG TPA: M20/M25/M40 family metallo-hydrolase [Clostridia bacterium]|nr:M20/M25/M40 family metallo-hydrolase [Clostridia bacterium]
MGLSEHRGIGVLPTIAAQQDVARLAEARALHEAFAWLRAHEREMQERQLEVTCIPAPPFGEDERSLWMEARFRDLGFSFVERDELGNVLALRPGQDESKKFVALSAHLDTVFPAGTPIHVHRSGDRLVGPGISDNSAGIVALVGIARALAAANIRTQASLLFIGNVGEEGEGDLRGMRHIFSQTRWREAIGHVLVLDGAGVDSIVSEGLGSRRFEVTIQGPGGHSWSDYGVPNPIVVLGRIIEALSRTPLPQLPKTTLNVGIIEGGTSINSIPESATMRVDLRSTDAVEIDRLEEILRRTTDEAVQTSRSEAQSRATLKSVIRGIGSRPAADLSPDARILHVIRAVDAHLQNPSSVHRASTDANIPLSLGIEAIAIGAGGSGGGAHTLHEWYDPRGRDFGLKRILLATLALSGAME